MKKNISINLQGIIFHIEEDGYDVLSRYLNEVKAYFAATEGHAEIVADIEGRIAELFSARISPSQQVITLADVEQMMAKMGRVSDFADTDAAEEAAEAAAGGSPSGAPRFVPPTEPDGTPRRLYRDMAHRKIAGVAAGLAQYFRLNPLWVRVGLVLLAVALPSIANFGFDGFGHGRLHVGSWVILAYIVLWIVLPKRYDAPTPLNTNPMDGLVTGNRLYRDADTGKVGGVAAGLAYYFHIDVVIVRVLFLLGLFLGGSAFVIYLILWIVVPEAKTPSEKLQMRGDVVNLANLSEQMQVSAGQEPGVGGGRSIGTYLEGAARGARPAVSFIGMLIRWFVGAILFIIGMSLLVLVVAFLGTTLGLWPAESVLHLGDAPADAVLGNVPGWGVGMGFLAVGVPALALVLLALRLFLRRSLLNRTAAFSLLGLWLVGVIGSGVATAQVVHHFQSRGSAVTTQVFNPGPARSTSLKLLDADNFLDHAELQIVAADSGQAIRLDQEVTARGSSRADANRTAAAGLDYDVQQRDSVLTFDEGPRLRPGSLYRNQELHLTLHLPLGRTYRLTNRFADRLSDEFFLNRDRPNYDGTRLFRFRRDGKLECLDCVPADGLGQRYEGANEDDNDGDHHATELSFGEGDDKFGVKVDVDSKDAGDNISINIKPLPTGFNPKASYYGEGRKRLDNPGTFTEIEASGGYRILVRPGSTYSVEAAGEQEELRNTTLEVSGNKLVIGRKGQNNFFHFGSDRHPVLVSITMPTLTALDLSGACRADVAGFKDSPLRVEGAGACTANLALDTPSLDLDLAGACHITATGRAENLKIDGAGACIFSGPNLQVRAADVDVSGGSAARVQVSENLKADASGASTIEYSGNPKAVDTDASGASRVKRL